jgi:hypothetical protein
MSHGAKATSVKVDGDPDGWTPTASYHGELDPRGTTRMVISVPVADVARIHAVLINSLKPPLSFLYRQKIDRRDPKPQAAPPRDFVGLQLSVEQVLEALANNPLVAYHDARAELWIRGALNEQVVLDCDGMLFAYPDDPSFRDALEAASVPEVSEQTMADRDYVKHWFLAEADAHEDGLIAALSMAEVPHRH